MEEHQPQLSGDAQEIEFAEQQRFKTLAVRVEEGLHAQLRFIAQLTGSSLTEEIRQALEARVATAQDDPDLIARAESARGEIEREAAARAAALAGFIGRPAVQAAAAATEATSKTRRATTKPSGE